MFRVIDRYITEEDVPKYGLADLPGLVRLAWSIALISPEQGDEIIADLCADVTSIVERDTGTAANLVQALRDRLQAEADIKAREFWFERIRGIEARAKESLAALLARTPEGFEPHGYCVYLLWPERGAEKPIYVGRSVNVLGRLGQHMNDREKRYRTGWVTILDCQTEAIMEKTEHRLIAHYKPELNICA